MTKPLDTGFERLRQEGRKQLLKLLNPYIQHDLTCPAIRGGDYEDDPRWCTCGLAKILDGVAE